MKRIAIIGGGWYGCYTAQIFARAGFCTTLFEKGVELFSEASSKNQNRLHKGYHYPRCAKTRLQSRQGFKKFINEFPLLTNEVEKNIYAVSNKNSLINFEGYCKIFADEGYLFKQIEIPKFLDSSKISGAISVNERVIDAQKAKLFWKQNLAYHQVRTIFSYEVSSYEFSKKQICSMGFDYVVDCTWGHLLANISERGVFYEKCVYFYLKAKKTPEVGALTIMDGPFFSIYPTGDNNIFTLTSVLNTPYIKSRNISDMFAREKPDLNRIKQGFYQELFEFYPSFSSAYEIIGAEFVCKTKLDSRNDGRYTEIESYGDGKFSVLSGKIDTIFELETLLEEIDSD